MPDRWAGLCRFLFSILSILLVMAFTAGCTAAAQLAGETAPAAAPANTWDWPVSTPEEQGLDAAGLEAAESAIQEQRLDVHSFLVIRNGSIVWEEYYAGYKLASRHEIFSITKSFIATLVGMAIDQELIRGVEVPVSELLPEYFEDADPVKAGMTLEDILTMTSGLGWVESDSAFSSLYRSPDWTGYMLGLDMADPPGEQWGYCSGCSHILSAILQRATGMNTQEFARLSLLEPLGITSYDWETDSQGLAIGGWGLRLTPRDMARLGLLYLQEGEWNGEQLVPADWIVQAVQTHVQANGAYGYGYQWWTYPQGEAYLARGRGGQLVFVSPRHDLIVVFTADLAGDDALVDIIESYVIPAAE